jgi:hypothetical protein
MMSNDEAHLPHFTQIMVEVGNTTIKLHTLKIESIVSGQCAALVYS